MTTEENQPPIHILSLGAGVQSSTMALMAARGELTPVPTAAIFADTQGEPQSVYEWLDWLEGELPFPVIRVTRGSLEDEQLELRESAKTGRTYIRNLVPAFTLDPKTGKKGLLGRRCTGDFKVIPIQQQVRKMVGIKRGGAGIVRAMMWIGISFDEAHRMKPSRVDYIEHLWPLVDRKMKRQHCKQWMTDHGYPEPPRSACLYCPFHSDYEWARLKREEPDEFAKAVEVERRLQEAAARQEQLKGVPFLHRSCVTLEQVDLRTAEEKGQGNLFDHSGWGNECEGLCGV